MIPLKHEEALKTIYSALKDSKIIWALTGSTSFILQGIDFNFNDIDIQTNKEGAYEIEKRLQEYVIMPVKYSESKKIRSHFGSLEIEGILIEIMGDIQKKLSNGLWEDNIDLIPIIKRIKYKNMELPVLDLNYEKNAYRILGREEKADEIEKFLQDNKS